MEGGVIHLTKEPTIVTVTVWLLFYFLSLKSNNQQLETGGPHMSSEPLMKLYQIIQKHGRTKKDFLKSRKA